MSFTQFQKKKKSLVVSSKNRDRRCLRALHSIPYPNQAPPSCGRSFRDLIAVMHSLCYSTNRMNRPFSDPLPPSTSLGNSPSFPFFSNHAANSSWRICVLCPFRTFFRQLTSALLRMFQRRREGRDSGDPDFLCFRAQTKKEGVSYPL
jgi:hypothetical protein